METYTVVSENERELYSKKASDVRDPAKRRELKINQFKREKELKGRIEVRHNPITLGLLLKAIQYRR